MKRSDKHDGTVDTGGDDDRRREDRDTDVDEQRHDSEPDEETDAPNSDEDAGADGSENASVGSEQPSQAVPVKSRPPRDLSAGWRGAPAWVVPVYVAGLVLVFLGQRALTALELGSTLLTWLGVAGVVFATLVRFSPKFGATGERGTIETLMRALSFLGLFALLLYGATTDWGQERLGLATQELETRERVLGVLSVAWLALILIATLPMLFAEASLRPMRRAALPESRRVKAAAGAGLALALAAVYGALFVFSADAADVKVDYSYFKTSGPSEPTKKIARSLQDQVKVTAFFPEVNEVKSEVQGYLNELSKGAPKLKVEVTDRLLVPKLARELRATQDGMIVLSKGKVTRSVVIGTELGDSRVKLKTLDRDFQAQLLKLARARRTVYMTVGHGELNDKGHTSGDGRSSQILDTLLRKQNYTVKELGLAQGLGNELPDDADIVMVLGPTEPFASEEVRALKNYVEAGGKLLLALDPDAISTQDVVRTSDLAEPRPAGAETDATETPEASKQEPKPESAGAKPEAAEPAAELANQSGNALGFEELLRTLGLEYSPEILANETKHVRRRYNDSDRVMLVTSSFSSHASVSTLSRNAPRAAIVVSGAGSLDPIKKVATQRENQIDFAVRSTTDTFADLDRDFKRDKDAEPAKSFNLGVAVSKKLGAKAKQPPKKEDDKQDAASKKDKAEESEKDPLEDLNEYRAFVLSDADALSDLVMANVPGNQFLFVDAVRWLGGEESWSGEQTTEEDVRIEHTKKEDQVWFYSTIFGAPALIFGAGVFVSRRARTARRRKGGKA